MELNILSKSDLKLFKYIKRYRGSTLAASFDNESQYHIKQSQEEVSGY